MNSKRIIQLDIIKIICTILILFHHFQQYTNIRFGYINFYDGSIYLGWIVEFFFIISGFVTHPYIQRIYDGLSFKDFFSKKYIRFVPRLFVGVVLFVMFTHIYNSINSTNLMNADLTLWNIVISTLGIQCGWVFKHPAINFPTWYVSCLLLSYIIFYFLTYISKRNEYNYRYVYCAMIFLGIGIYNYNIYTFFFNEYTARSFYSFFTGLLLCELFQYINNNKSNNIKKYTLISFLASLSLLILFVLKKDFTSSNLNFVLTFLFYPSILFFSIFGIKIENNNKYISTMSKAAFGAYILHTPLLVMLYLLPNLLSVNHVLLMIVFTMVAFIAGYYLELLCEWLLKKIEW